MMFEVKPIHPYRKIKFLNLAVSLSMLGWAISATLFGLQKQPKEMPLIAIEDSVPRIIQIEDENDIRKEKIKFIKRFLNRYYTYDLETFEDQVGEATDLMRRDYWLSIKKSILDIEDKLKAEPYSQKSSIDSIMEDDKGGFDASLITVMIGRVKKEKFRTRVHIEISRKPRTDINPWKFEVTHVSEQIEPL